LETGHEVRMKNLTSAEGKTLNGKFGVIRKYDNDSGRFLVTIENYTH